MIDRADRRNRLLDRVSAGWRSAPPPHFLVAAGITTAAPAIARLLRTVADLPQGMVVLPGLDLGMAAEEWEALGSVKPDPEKPGERPLETHPQYHLKLLLDRMGVSRDEVVLWDAASEFDGPAAREPFVSLLFAPADYTAQWQAAGDLSVATAGISGAVQHRVGMEGADAIAAINVDANAPIFDFANYALVGNALELLPALQAAFEKRLAAARARQGAAAQDEGAR